MAIGPRTAGEAEPSIDMELGRRINGRTKFKLRR
jgi:hypothetical protein